METSSKFWKLFFGSGSVTAVNALRAFAVNKLLAVFLPPAAFACVGQFMNWMSIGQATSSLAMQNGWVSLTAQNKDNLKELHGVWRGGFRITTFATIATCILAVIFCFAAPLEKMLPGIHPRLAQAAILFALPCRELEGHQTETPSTSWLITPCFPMSHDYGTPGTVSLKKKCFLIFRTAHSPGSLPPPERFSPEPFIDFLLPSAPQALS